MRIAIYGKGGIGKSTTSSNLSYCLARMGASVLQIGCDPKHDSTRQLIGGANQRTVLEYVRDTPPSKRLLSDVMMTGSAGVSCIEAGGPEPGIGCAGRGILTMFETLKRLGVDDVRKDIIVYDVLGDVVCGGFAVPMRAEHSDAVYIVTSGEFMSLYAANNILKGLLNFGAERPRVAGLIFNERGSPDEHPLVQRFAEAVELPIVVTILRSVEFMSAEKEGRTVSELYPDSTPASIYRDLAEDVILLSEGGRALHVPKPLTDDQLNDLLSGRSLDLSCRAVRKPACTAPKHLGMASCASRGAAFEAGRVTDLPIIVHGPDSCGYVMSHTQDSHYLSDMDADIFLVPKMRNNIVCTGMTNDSSVFGGVGLLSDKIDELYGEGNRIIAVVTTCVSGMIGDDVDRVARDAMASHPDLKVLTVHADGNLSGDSEEGRDAVIESLVEMIDHATLERRDTVNLVDDTFMWYSRGRNDVWTREILGALGLELGVKIFEDCTLEDIRSCGCNRFTILADDTERNRFITDLLKAKGFLFELPTLPKGFREAVGWAKEVGTATGREAFAEDYIRSMESEYCLAVSEAGILRGRKIDFAVSAGTDVDWMVDTLLDVGADVRHAYLFRTRSSEIRVSRYRDRIDMVNVESPRALNGLLSEDPPELIIGMAHMFCESCFKQVDPPQECIGHRASIEFLRIVCNILRSGTTEGWKSWGDAE